MPPRPPSTTPNPAFTASLQRGMIIRIDSPQPTGAGASPGNDFSDLTARAITFQYNPETISRSRSGRWQARSRRNRSVASPQDLRSRDGSGSGQLLADSETISLKITFDATEQRLDGTGNDGVLPELGFLENASMGRDRNRGLEQGESTQPVRPDELLLVLGPKRTFPVVLTSLSIAEQKFAPDLTPIRADVDMRFNVLEPVDVSLNRWVAEAFQQVVNRRTTLSRRIESSTDVDAAIRGALDPAATQR